MRKDASPKVSDFLAARILSPGKLYAFWHLQEEKLRFVARYFMVPEEQTVMAVRLFDLTLDEKAAVCIHEMILRPGVSSWLFKGVYDHHNYLIELGIKRNDADFFPLLKSNPIFHNQRSVKVGFGKVYPKSPGWVRQVSTYTYYENL